MIADTVHAVMNDIAETALRCGREPGDITLVAVTKTRTVAEIEQAVAAGVVHLGENRVQEAETKIPDINGDVIWHCVGHLQSNKAKKAAALFQWIDSVDSAHLAGKLASEASESGKILDVLVQVNVSGEQSKSGVDPDDAEDLVSYATGLSGLRVRGLMTIGSLDATENVTRREFASMRDLYERLGRGRDFDILSMGMSGDYRIAVEEGSTMVRIGTTLFGDRA